MAQTAVTTAHTHAPGQNQLAHKCSSNSWSHNYASNQRTSTEDKDVSTYIGPNNTATELSMEKACLTPCSGTGPSYSSPQPSRLVWSRGKRWSVTAQLRPTSHIKATGQRWTAWYCHTQEHASKTGTEMLQLLPQRQKERVKQNEKTGIYFKQKNKTKLQEKYSNDAEINHFLNLFVLVF